MWVEFDHCKRSWSLIWAAVFSFDLASTQVRPNGSSFVRMGFIRHFQRLWTLDLGCCTWLRAKDTHIRPNVGLLTTLRLQTIIERAPIFSISPEMIRNTCEHLETRALSSTLMSKSRTQPESPRNLPKTPKMISKHHGDKNKVKSSV